MFTKKTRMVYPNLGLATIACNKLRATEPGAEYGLARVSKGVAIVPLAKDKPAGVGPSPSRRKGWNVQPVIVGETATFFVRMRSQSDKWITLREPMPNGTIWVYRPYVTAIRRLPDRDDCELVVPLQVARKKGWAD